MKAVVTDKRPCKLERGEMRRVPQDRRFKGIVGYHLGCPRCGFVTIAFQGHEGLHISEEPDRAVSFSTAVRCVFCNTLLELKSGDLRWMQDGAAREVRYIKA